jgi:diphthine synthase
LGRRTHDLERDFLLEFAVDKEGFNAVWKKDYEGKN